MRMLFVALKGPAITVNFVNDALRRRPGDHVDGIYERVRLGRADAFCGTLRQSVEFHDLVIEQGEY